MYPHLKWVPMADDQNVDPTGDTASRTSDSQTEIQVLVNRSKRIRSEIESLNSQIDAVDQAIETPTQLPDETPLPPTK
jgi:hypothetical protein